jgi:protein TonB
MDYSFEPRDPSRRFKGLVIVIALHVVIGYLLVTGLAVKGLNIIKKPLEAVVIQEVIIPPPPPPPPPPKKIEKTPDIPQVVAPPPPFVPPPEVTPQVTSTAPVIESVATPPPAPVAIAPPPPPNVPVVVGPKHASISVTCPKQVPPDYDASKAHRDGIEGVVKVRIHIKDGVVVDVAILSGPRALHSLVKGTIMKYKCVSDSGDAYADQEFNFKLPE